MAQAARLNLRMQKELKLLLTDPPPGASFPLLYADSNLSSFSLSTIHAQIQGPEGTVYEKGTFKIDIQIPERYPFQPPTVTFATPIYHPNIDTGGRICLDILNLPPKGAWQPSLNISTVLTSIGLLLSEPNPDDGLMIEASKEYKYNRQVFNQKARLFAENHARSGGSEIDSRNPNLQSHPNKITGESKESSLPTANGNEYAASSKKHLGMSRKLLLEPSGPIPRDSNKELKELSFCHLSENQLGAQGPIQDSKDMSNECCREGTRRRLALGSLNTSISRNGDKKENVGPHLGTLMPVLQSSQFHEQPVETYCENQDFQPIVGVSKKLSIGQKQLLKTSKPDQRNDYCQENLAIMPRPLPYESVPKASEIQPQKGSVDKLVTGFTNPLRKKLGLAGKKSSSGFITSLQKENKDNKENIAPVSNTIRSPSMSSNTSRTVHLYEERSGSNNANTNAKKFPLQPLGQYEGIKECHTQLQQGQGERFAGGNKQSKDETLNLEAVIVLDSEDSEEERDGNSRSKLSIVRKRLPGKRKAIR